jgi:hypothetical protein
MPSSPSRICMLESGTKKAPETREPVLPEIVILDIGIPEIDKPYASPSIFVLIVSRPLSKSFCGNPSAFMVSATLLAIAFGKL